MTFFPFFFFILKNKPIAYASSRTKTWIWPTPATYATAAATSEDLIHCVRLGIEHKSPLPPEPQQLYSQPIMPQQELSWQRSPWVSQDLKLIHRIKANVHTTSAENNIVELSKTWHQSFSSVILFKYSFSLICSYT